MSKYNYRARDKSGQLVTGTVESGNEYEVAASLKDAGYSVIEITPQAGLGEYAGNFGRLFSRVGRQEIIVFTRQLATLLRTGNTLTSSLDSVAEQVRNPKFKEIIREPSIRRYSIVSSSLW
jgi:type II secretory pathway component PulF